MTTLKTLAIAATLTLLPGFAMAMCSGDKHQQAQSCASGMTYDATTHTCVPSANS